MNQQTILDIIKELGGVADSRQIHEYMIEHKIDDICHKSVMNHLKRIQKWGDIKRDGKFKRGNIRKARWRLVMS